MTNETCRSCLKDGFDMKSLFTRGMICKKILSLRDLLLTCADLEINRDDGFPQHICKSCINIIESAYSFRMMCEKNERLLKQQFEQIETTQSEVDYENDKIDFDENGFEATDQYVEISDDELLTNNVVAILEDPISDQFEKLEDHKIESNDPKDEPISEKKSKAVKNNKLINVNEGAKKHNCTQCKRQFKLKTSLDLHIIRNHSGSATLDEAKLICSICNKKCVSEIHYNRHMNYHRTGKQYHCDICGRDFSQYRSYESHKYSHTGERPFLCTECGKTFKQNCDLEIHMRLHSNSYPYICNICGAKYRYSSIFTLHKRTHSGEKPFECPFCDKKFRNSCRLKVHKRVHTGEKPYVCQICQKAFARPYALKVHTQTHTGERPHLCTICNKGFAQAHCLRSHMKLHEKNKIVKNEPCNDSENAIVELNEVVIEENMVS